MKMLTAWVALAMGLSLAAPQGRAGERGVAVGKKLARKGQKAKKNWATEKMLAASAVFITKKQYKKSLKLVQRILVREPENKRALAYKLVLGELLELKQTRKPIRPLPKPKPWPKGQLNGTPGNWKACRGTGAHVCVEKIPPQFETYWRNHPRCVPNKTCKGSYFLCNEACPPPGPADQR